MKDIDDKITLLKTELNLTQDPTAKQELNKKLNVLFHRKEIEQIKTRIKQLSNA